MAHEYSHDGWDYFPYKNYHIDSNQNQKYKQNKQNIYLDSELNLQIFYNLTDKNNVPWGSTYSYQLPTSMQQDEISGKSNIYKNKKKEHYSRKQKESLNYTHVMYFIIIIMIIAMLYDLRKNNICFYS